MDLSTKLWKSAVSLLTVAALVFSTPAYAKKQKHKRHKHRHVVVQQHKILATSYLVQDLDTGEIIAEKNSNQVRSIASITKLMTAVVVLDAKQNMDERIEVQPLPGVHSRIQHSTMSRGELMLLALMSSDNLATKTLAVNYPGGEQAAIDAMNAKANSLGMSNTHFVDPTGLFEENVSNSHDLIKLVDAAEHYDYIKFASTYPGTEFEIHGRTQKFNPTNKLVTKISNIVVSKTGWIRRSGGCLVMNIHNDGRRLAVVLLNSKNTRTRIRDGELLYGLQHGKNI